MLINLFVTTTVLLALGNCNPCPNKDDIKLYNKNNPSNPVCWPHPKCNDGQEASVKPGSSHPLGTIIKCNNCREGYFSNNSTDKRCHRCTSCGNNKELSPCKGFRDRQCSHTCISGEFYFNGTDQQCYPCTECCRASDEDIEPQCIAMRVGTVIGGNGEKHCKASFNSSQQCSNELERNASSPACGNSSFTSSSSFETTGCSCGNNSLPSELNVDKRASSCSIDRGHIALICVVSLLLLLIVFLVSCWYASRRNTGGQSSRRGCVSSCADQGCGMEMASFIPVSCHDKLKLIPDGIKIDNIEPCEVENILIERLDINQRCVKNWWDVGRRFGISNSMLQNMKKEENKEDGSPTRCLLGKLSTLENVVSLREFVETTHKLNRHDICTSIYEFYQSQQTTA